MSPGRGHRVSAFDRAQQAQIDLAVQASTSDQQDLGVLPPLPQSAATPFQTLHGTLDNTTTASGSGSAALDFSSSSDQYFKLPTSNNPPQLAPKTVTSSISNPDPTLSGPSAQTDEIENSFSSLIQSANKRVDSTSEIENSTMSGGGDTSGEILGVAENGGGGFETVPDSDNEANGSAPLGSGFGFGDGAEEGAPEQPVVKTTTSKSSSSNRRPVIEVPSAGERSKASSVEKKNSKTTKGKGKESNLSKETVDSDEEADESTNVGGSKKEAAGKGSSKGKRTIAIESSEEEEVEVAGKKKPIGKNKKQKKDDLDSLSGDLTDYDDLNVKSKSKSKPKGRTSSTVSKKQVARSSPDPISAPLESSAAATSKSAPERVNDSSSASNAVGQPLERQLSDHFGAQAMQIEQRQEKSDDDFHISPVKKGERKSTVNRTRTKSVESGQGKGKGKGKGKATRAESKDETNGGGDEDEAEEEVEVGGRGKAAAKGKGKAKAKEKQVTKKNGKKDTAGVVEPEEEQDIEGQTAEGTRKSPRVNKGKPKQRLVDGEEEEEEEVRSPPSKKRTVSKGKRKATIVSSEPEDEAVIESSQIDGDGTKEKTSTTTDHSQPIPSASTTASTSRKRGSVSPAVSRSSRTDSAAKKSVSPAISRGRTMSTEEKKADRAKRMDLVMEAAKEDDPDAFNFANPAAEKKQSGETSESKSKPSGSKAQVEKGKKRKIADSESDADDESEELSEAEESDDEEEKNKSKGKGVAKAGAALKVLNKVQVAKENEKVPTPKPKAVSALARGRDRSASPFSKTPRPGTLADIIAKRGIGSYRSPGLSARAKVPSLHQNLKPPPPPRKIITEKRPVKKKKKGEYSCSDEEKPWYEAKDPEEWDSDDCARWRRRQQRIDKGLPADTESDSDSD